MITREQMLVAVYWGGDEAVAAVTDYLNQRGEMVDRITEVFAATRWIPVTERLPEEDRLVLWYRPEERWPVTTGRFERPNHVDEGGDLCVPFSEGRYTHWMPLPEPPEANQ